MLNLCIISHNLDASTQVKFPPKMCFYLNSNIQN